MSARKISQRQAQALKRENKTLRDERDALFRRAASNYPGIQIDTIKVNSTEWWTVMTAKKLGCAVLLVPEEADESVRVYALKAPK